jgi:hypothetical protein
MAKEELPAALVAQWPDEAQERTGRTPPMPCGSRRAAIIACCAWRARSADLDGAEKVGRVHFAEALSYRALVDEVRRAA